MKKIQVLFVLIFGIMITSCQTGSEIKIGFLMPDGEGSRWPIDQGYVEAAAEEYGYEVLSRFVENDENKQQKQAQELLEMGVDVLIVVSVNSNTAAAIVRDAHEYDVPVIGYDRIILNSDLDYFVTFEGAQIGNAMVEHALEKVPQGNYVLLWGDAGDKNAFFIKDAQEAMLKPHVEKGDINIVYKGYVENWTEPNAYYMMGNIIDFSDQKIDAVITSYDGLAIGALNAFKDRNAPLPEVLTGQDAEIQAIKAIVDGEMTLTVYKSIREIATASVDLAVKLAKGENIEEVDDVVFNGRKDVPAIMIKPVAVTRDNIHQTVIADGFYTEEEIFGD